MDRLIEAVTCGDLSSLKSLVCTKQSDPTAVVNTPVDEEGTTLLHLAANSTIDVLYYLLDNDAVVSFQTDDGLTPLHVAAMWGKEELVRILLSYGADPLICDNEEMVAADHARNEGHYSCAKLLESNDPYDEATLIYTDSVPNDMSMAESFVAMFETFSIDETVTDLPDEHIQNYPDIVQDTFHQASHLVPADDSYTLPSLEQMLQVSTFPSQTSSANSSPSYQPVPTSPSSPATPQSQASSLTYCQTTPTQSEANVSPSTPSSEGVVSPCNTTILSESVMDCSFAREIQVKIPRHIRKLKDSELVDQLVSLGEVPGPITESTRKAYMVYLTKLERGVHPAGNSGYKGFKYELALVLNSTAPIPNLRCLEEEIVQEFSTPQSLGDAANRMQPLMRRTTVRDNFNYLLLDPRELKDGSTHGERSSPVDLVQFRKFMESVFYVGKGKNSRPVQHLKDAKNCLTKTKITPKLSRIADIWHDGYGVISLPLFHNTVDGEAFTRESCMIDAIGMDNLTNKVKGHTHGGARQWPMSRRRQFGVYLLHKAFLVYMLTPPPEIRKHDLS